MSREILKRAWAAVGKAPSETPTWCFRQYNAFGKYHYRNAEDTLEAVNPLLGESILTLSDEVLQIGER